MASTNWLMAFLVAVSNACPSAASMAAMRACASAS
jgi:hypothetical protein